MDDNTEEEIDGCPNDNNDDDVTIDGTNSFRDIATETDNNKDTYCKKVKEWNTIIRQTNNKG